MDVIFRRTGERRYAVIVRVSGQQTQLMDPAPGFDEHIPHDLVHYVVEAELGMHGGVFGRAVSGGGTFIPVASDGSARERGRQRRKQLRREASLRSADEAKGQDMVRSEQLAGVCDLHWRRRQGQRPDTSRPAPREPLSPEDAKRVERVVHRLDELAPLWNQLPMGGELLFTWPNVVPKAIQPLGSETAPIASKGAR